MHNRPGSHTRLPDPRFVPFRWGLMLAALLAGSVACTTVTGLLSADQEGAESLARPGAVTEIVGEEDELSTEATPTATTIPEAVGSAGGISVGGESLQPDGVQATADGEISGPILRVQITNPTDGEVVAEIPCGLIFEPQSDPDEQRLMTIQTDATELGAGESKALNPYVICIDGDLAAPSSGSTYRVGPVASDDLGAFAECLCDLDLEAEMEGDITGGLGLQFAIWMTSDGLSPEEYFEEMDFSQMPIGEDEFGDMFGEEFAELFATLEALYMEPAVDWLDRCGVEPGP